MIWPTIDKDKIILRITDPEGVVFTQEEMDREDCLGLIDSLENCIEEIDKAEDRKRRGNITSIEAVDKKGKVWTWNWAASESIEHVWDGEETDMVEFSSKTCSKCGKSAFDHDMWIGE